MNWWTRFLHTLTGWRNYRVPEMDRIDIRRPRLQLWTQLDEIDWGVMAGQSIDERRYDLTSPTGIGRGYPMQVGSLLRRSVTWGRVEWGERNVAQIPRVHGGYWVTGDPTPQWDKRAVVWDIDGTSWIIFQFDQTAPARSLPWPNQAYNVTHADVDEVLSGRGFTTGHNPAARVWTPWSHLAHHEQALIVADYVGADGVLTKGPRAGQLVVLDRRSQSFARMMVEGGQCAERAEALATHGARIVDRCGYAGVPHHQTHTHVGTRPRPPSLLTQAGRQWGNTNLHRFDVALADLKAAS